SGAGPVALRRQPAVPVAPEDPGTPPSTAPPLPRGGRRARDVLALASYLALALFVGWPLWRPGAPRAVADGQDQALCEWMLAHAAWALEHARSPLYASQLNVPHGGNLMANVSMLGLGLPMAPVTLLFGAPVTYTVLTVAGLSGTAGGWYLVLRRLLVRSRWAAWAGGLLAGFGPGMLAESLGHLHLVTQFLVPWLVLVTVRVGRTGRPRDGVLLGFLVAWQALIAEEVLLLAATTAVLVVAGYALVRAAPRVPWRNLAVGLAAAAAVAAAALAYPLGVQFTGPGHLHGLPYDAATYSADLAAYPALPSVVWAGTAGGNDRAALLALNSSEQTTFFGWTLLLVLAALVAWAWRDRLVRALTLVVLTCAALSLGPQVILDGRQTGWWAPYRLLAGLPLYKMLLPTRFGLVVLVLLAVILARCVDRLVTAYAAGAADPGPAGRSRVRVERRVLAGGGLLAVAVALGLLAPTPLPSSRVAPVPAFIADGTWRGYVPPGRTLVPVPLPSFYEIDGMRWSARAGLDFAMPQGFLIVPDPVTGAAEWNEPPRPVAIWLDQVAITGQVHPAAPNEDVILRNDLRYWRAAVLVLDPRHRYAAQLRVTLAQFLGPPQAVDGVWLWDVRGLQP
ncbi:MAG TPA: hypothetical protein VHA75_01895, partial [Rugosimonospora sp.]|nr:hypothetical protein [Rugosimonospora sp.]